MQTVSDLKTKGVTATSSSLVYQRVQHPVALHKLSVLRDKKTSSMAFRQIMEEISQLLAYEVSRDLRLAYRTIETPLETAEVEVIDEDLVLVAVLRAGNGMINGMAQILPFATIGHIGIYRDRFIHGTVEYYLRLPKQVKGKRVLLVDPLLATGDTACAAIQRLKEFEVGPIRYVCILASSEGIAKVNKLHPDVEIYTLNVEKGLNSQGFLLPGLGDAGDRLYDTV